MAGAPTRLEQLNHAIDRLREIAPELTTHLENSQVLRGLRLHIEPEARSAWEKNLESAGTTLYVLTCAAMIAGTFYQSADAINSTLLISACTGTAMHIASVLPSAGRRLGVSTLESLKSMCHTLPKEQQELVELFNCRDRLNFIFNIETKYYGSKEQTDKNIDAFIAWAQTEHPSVESLNAALVAVRPSLERPFLTWFKSAATAVESLIPGVPDVRM